MKFIHFIFFVVGIMRGISQVSCDQTVSGQVLDIDTKEPLPYATVRIEGTDRGVVTDIDGFFTLEGICDQEIHLEVQSLGYKKIVHHHDLHHSSPKIYLASEETLLESVIVEEKRAGKLQSLSMQKKEINELSRVSSSIGELTESLSGVSLLKTGSNISKPMIHGLHSNRVLVINDGIRHAYQVWGQEHAPEIDPSHVDQIEVVKGANTVKYGPEALGGVILYNSKKPAFDKAINGSLSSSYQTNGKAVASQLSIGQGFHRFAWNLGAGGIYQGDKEAPDYMLTNTGKQEYGGSFHTLLHLPKFDIQVSGNYLDQELGILRGSIVGNLEDLQNAIDRAVPASTRPFSYDITNPKQETKHGMIKSDISYYQGDHVFNLQYAYQKNIRREYDVRRGELNNRPVIDLELLSHTIDTEWKQPETVRWNGSSGVQIFTQNSVNEPGSNPVNFIPDYDVLNIGAFTVQSYDLDNTTIETGVRFDFQSLEVADTIRNDFIYANKVTFSNGTYTLGVRKKINKKFSIFSNIGSAWRPPNVAELYSFGYHNSRIQFGLWRYETEPEIATPLDEVFDQTDRPVPPETAIKWVSGIELASQNITSEFIFFLNRIDNYIYMRPYGIVVNATGTFPYFLYSQTDAFFTGVDWDIQFHHEPTLVSEFKVSYVYASERKTNQQLVEVPPLCMDYNLSYKKGNFSYGFDLNYTATQWNAPPTIEPGTFEDGDATIEPGAQIFDFMNPPSHYLLVGLNVSFNNDRWSAIFKADNLLNSSYRIYTDRLRYFADAPGRNLSLSIQYNF